MKFTQVPVTTMQALQINAGMVVDEFDPESLEIGNQLGATSGGVEFDPHPTFEDYGEGIDNLPPNTWQLKRLKSVEPHLTGTFKTMTAALGQKMQPGAALTANHVVPGSVLTEEHFTDCWLIGDYSDVNTGANPGYIAIHLKNAMNVLGFRLKTNDEGKGDFAFDFQAHYDLTNIDDIPFEFYIQSGKTAD